MAELTNYSGEFKSDLKFEDFSKEFLAKMMHAWSQAYLRLDEKWFQLVQERAGEGVANYCREAIWPIVAKATLPKIARALDIQVNDIVDVMKVWQVAPDGIQQTGLFESEFEIKERNHVIHTVTHCLALERIERNAPDKIRWLCHDVEKPAFEGYIRAFLPDAQVKPLILRSEPRKSLDEPACKWEYKL